MSQNEDAKSEVDVPAAIDPYEVLGLETTATEDEVKKAYRLAALKNHPDKVPAERKDEAHTAFQRIAFAYAILSSPSRRRLYDETGSTDETVSADPDWSWSNFFRAQYADVVTADAIDAFAAKYRHTQEERGDVLNAYTAAKGDMDKVFTEVMLSRIEEDHGRFKAIIDEAIAKGEVEEYPAYKCDGQKREKRRRKAKKEAKEAEDLARQLGVHDNLFGTGGGDQDNHDTALPASKAKKTKKSSTKKEDQEARLAAVIRSRHSNSAAQESFLDRLVEKYGAQEAGKKGKKKAKMHVATIEEPPDDAFLAMARRVDRNKKRKAVEEEDEEGESLSLPRRKGSKNARV